MPWHTLSQVWAGTMSAWMRGAAVLVPAVCSGQAVLQVKGNLEQDGEKVPGVELIGKWDQGLSVTRNGGASEQLWKPNPKPANPTRCACQTASSTGWCHRQSCCRSRLLAAK